MKDKKILWVIGIILLLLLFNGMKKEARPYTTEEFNFKGVDWISSRITPYIDGNPNDPAATGTTGLGVGTDSIIQSYNVMWDGGDPPSVDGSVSFIIPNKTDEINFRLKYEAGGGTGSSGSAGCNIDNVNFISHSTYRSRQTDWKPPITKDISIKKSTDNNFWVIVNEHSPTEGESILIGEIIDGMKLSCYGTIRAEESSASASLNIDNFDIIYNVVSCVDTSWTPYVIEVCDGESFTQTSNCGTTRDSTGTKDCGNGNGGEEETESEEEDEINPIIYFFGLLIFIKVIGGK